MEYVLEQRKRAQVIKQRLPITRCALLESYLTIMQIKVKIRKLYWLFGYHCELTIEKNRLLYYYVAIIIPFLKLMEFNCGIEPVSLTLVYTTLSKNLPLDRHCSLPV